MVSALLTCHAVIISRCVKSSCGEGGDAPSSSSRRTSSGSTSWRPCRVGANRGRPRKRGAVWLVIFSSKRSSGEAGNCCCDVLHRAPLPAPHRAMCTRRTRAMGGNVISLIEGGEGGGSGGFVPNGTSHCSFATPLDKPRATDRLTDLEHRAVAIEQSHERLVVQYEAEPARVDLVLADEPRKDGSAQQTAGLNITLVTGWGKNGRGSFASVCRRCVAVANRTILISLLRGANVPI